MSLERILVPAALALALAMPVLAEDQVTVRTVATSPLSGAFGLPVINSWGAVAYEETISVAPELYRVALNNPVGASGSLAATGGAAPGLDTNVVFDWFGAPVLNDEGQVAFSAALKGPGVVDTNDYGLWAGVPGQVNLVAREGDPAPDTPPGAYYDDFYPVGIGGFPSLNASGQVTLTTTLSGPGVTFTNRTGIWGGTNSGAIDGPFLRVAREGDNAVGIGGAYYRTLLTSGSGLLPVNQLGYCAFAAALTGAGVNANNQDSVWLVPNIRTNPAILVAREGDPAPGTPGTFFVSDSGYTFTMPPALSGDGLVAFGAGLTGVPGGTDTGIWAGGAGALQLVVRAGDPAPGAVGAVKFAHHWTRPVLSGERIAFIHNLTGADVNATNNAGIWAGTLTAPKLVARLGDRAPGTGGNAYFSQFSGLALNPSGQVAFTALLAGPGVQSSNDLGIWATDNLGNLWLLAREGDALPGGGTISNLGAYTSDSTQYASGGQDGMRACFNSAGELAFEAWLVDGSSGVFVAALPDHRPRITEIRRNGADLEIKFTTFAGGQYRLERSPSLQAPSWTTQPDLISGTGDIVTATDAGAAEASGWFYRVALVL